MGQAGFEPATLRASVECSPTELLTHKEKKTEELYLNITLCF